MIRSSWRAGPRLRRRQRLAGLRLRIAYAAGTAGWRLYDRIVERCGRLAGPPECVDERIPSRKRDGAVVYYLWRFPLLSETFIQREIAALRAAGVTLVVVADRPGRLDELDPAARALAAGTTYLFPASPATTIRYAALHIARGPLAFTRLVVRAVGARYAPEKRAATDFRIVLKAAYLAGRLRALGAGHVHAPWADTNAFILQLAARSLGVSYSVQARAHDVHRDDCAAALRDQLAPARFIVTNTSYNATHLRSLLPPGQYGKLHVVHNGIDPTLFTARRPAAPDADVARILCVARLVEQKGLTVLLHACDLLRARGHRFHCEVIGGPDEPRYASYFVQLKLLHRQLGLEGVVDLVGARPFDAVLRAYEHADLFVLPCVVATDRSRDISPNAVIEAMAMRLPVVSTFVGGIPELVTDGESGLLVPPDDAGALAAAMIRLIEDPALRARLGERARTVVEEKFDIRRNVLRYVELFASAGAGRGRASA